MVDEDMRDLFAGLAMQAVVQRVGFVNEEGVAEIAYKLADAMVKERNKDARDKEST